MRPSTEFYQIPSTFQKNIRKIIKEISVINSNAKINIGDETLSSISADRYSRDVFLTGVYFGYFSYFKNNKTNDNPENKPDNDSNIDNNFKEVEDNE